MTTTDNGNARETDEQSTAHPSAPLPGWAARARQATHAGLCLSVLAVLVPIVAQATAGAITDHVRAGHPHRTPAQVDEQVAVIVGYVVVVGLIAVLAWTLTARAVKARRPWARTFATVMFGVGTAVSVANLMVSDVWAEVPARILPLWGGLLGLLPCVAGAATTYLLWKATSPSRR